MDWNTQMEKMSVYRNELDLCRDDLTGIRRRIKRHKENINSHWKSDEVYAVNEIADDILRDIQRVCNQMEDMSDRMNKVMYIGEMENNGTD